jgi:hypothetical protein
MVMRPEDLRGMTSAQRDKLKRAELIARQKAQMKKPSTSTGMRPAPKMPTGLKKKATTPKPFAGSKPIKRTALARATKAPMVKPTVKPKVQESKKKTLDDFLLKGKRPPMKIKPGLKRPSDADVILKGYNDKKYKGK